MKRYLIKIFYLLFVLCLFIFSFQLIDNNVKADSGPGIAVNPEYPKEQIKENGIFNTNFQPNKNYNLTLKIANISNESRIVNISPNTAYTSNNGTISFDRSKAPNDSSRKYDFRSLFKQKNIKINIPAGSVKKVKFNLKMPPKQYQGIIAGGFYVTIPNNNESNTKSNFEINNNFSYAIAAVIHEGNETAQPNIKLNNVKTNDNGNQVQVTSNIRNIGSGIISGMNVNSKITNISNNKVISKYNNNNLNMAPNSYFNYENTINHSLSPGNYNMSLNIKDDSGNTWQENKHFQITTRNYATHFIKKISWSFYILIGTIILLVFVIISLIIYLMKHNKNSKK